MIAIAPEWIGYIGCSGDANNFPSPINADHG